MQSLKLAIEQWIGSLGIGGVWINTLSNITLVIMLVALSILVYYITKKVFFSFIIKIAQRSKTQWDDVMLKRKIFSRASLVVPVLIIYFGLPHIFPESPFFIQIIEKSIFIFLIFWGALLADSVLYTLNDIYENFEMAAERPIKSYIQVVQIVVYLTAVLLIFAILLDKSVTYLLAGLGTLTAIFMLVFKDSFLGLAAGIQMSLNKIVRIGDWITVPSQNTDGIISEITLTTIKVQNWDNTTIILPSYTLVSNSFQNWRGMEESGGRRVKRSLLIDQSSIKFNTDAMNERFKKVDLIRDYIVGKQTELQEYNDKLNFDKTAPINGRQMTNLGTFRHYIYAYLLNHSQVNKELTVMVRHLSPTDKGLPLELYFFSTEKRWVYYEAIQADIFDHILAAVEYFELRVFQVPTGFDMRQITR